MLILARKCGHSLIHDKKEAVFEEPKDTGEDATRGQLKKYEMLLRMNLEDEKQYKKDKSRMFS